MVPTRLPIRPQNSIVSELAVVALISMLPWFACLLLAHAFPAIAGAFAVAGQIS